MLTKIMEPETLKARLDRSRTPLVANGLPEQTLAKTVEDV